MAGNFSPSVNIIRDFDQQINYITTPNATSVFTQLISNYQAGHHCFSIIGAYGTGKSAFIWALEKTLNKKQPFFLFPKNAFLEKGEAEIVYIVGDYSSLIEAIAAKFIPGILDHTVSEVIQGVEDFYGQLKKNNKRLLLVIDEFGKFLEFAAKHNPEQELYFIQQLAEYINDKSREILLITVLHQDFSAYAHELTRSQKEEWTKVKGRLKELTFNEPVEQLLLLASQRLGSSSKEIDRLKVNDLLKAIATANVFPLKDYFDEETAWSVFPLDILAAAVLAQAMQKYGQNERSLFTFLESDDQLGLNSLSKSSDFYNVSHVHDYLNYHFYSLLRSKNNPHFSQWTSLKSALERTEVYLEKETEDARKLLKTIGLLTIFTHEGAQFDKKFLVAYGKLALGIPDPEKTIQALENHKIIRFAKHRNRYLLFEGTDLDIELAIDEAGQLVEHVTDVVKHLKQHFSFPYIQAKQVSYEKGTPRIFEFRLTKEPILEIPQGEVDGYINLIISEKLTLQDVKSAIGEHKEAILYGLYRNTSEIKNLIREIEKIKKVKEQNPNDKVALREIEEILNHQVKLLNHYVIGSLYSNDGKVEWYFNGEAETAINSRSSFNRCLSSIGNEVYYKAPSFKSELVNRTKLSGAIAGARKNFIHALTEHWNEKDLGFPEKNFPPEKTIYLSLLQATGMHVASEEKYILTSPNEPSFEGIWKACTDFVEGTRIGEKKVQELVDILLQQPYKVKQGFIEFWLPVFLFSKRSDFAMFGPGGAFVPDLNAEIFDHLIKNPDKYGIKAFDVEGIRLSFFNQYRDIIQKAPVEYPTQETFIDTIKPFLVFYKGLPEFSKKTAQLSKEGISLRRAIAKFKDPEAAFFEDLPQALGYTLPSMKENEALQEEYIVKLQDKIKELRDAYNQLVIRLENFISHKVVGTEPELEKYRLALQKRYQYLLPHQLETKQKAFLQRLKIALDDRNAWLNSIATLLVQKPLSSFDDTDEAIFYQHFKRMVYSLDRLTDLANANVDVEREDAFKIEINSFEGGLQQQIIRLPKNQSKELQAVVEDIQLQLCTLDKQQAIAVLTNLLKEQLKDE